MDHSDEGDASSESNMMRRSRSKGENSILMSLTLIEEGLGDKARMMGQSGNSVEEVCLEQYERRRIRLAYRSIAREWGELLTEVCFQGRLMVEVALSRRLRGRQ